jgi:hypothetical protein
MLSRAGRVAARLIRDGQSTAGAALMARRRQPGGFNDAAATPPAK